MRPIPFNYITYEQSEIDRLFSFEYLTKCNENKFTRYNLGNLSSIPTWENYLEIDKIPWAIKSLTVDELLIETIIVRLTNLFEFMEEAWRVLKPNGLLLVRNVPYYRSDRWMENPYNVTPIMENTFAIFSKDWCLKNNILHKTFCNWTPIGIKYEYEDYWLDKSESAKNFARTHNWNVIKSVSFALGVIK